MRCGIRNVLSKLRPPQVENLEKGGCSTRRLSCEITAPHNSIFLPLVHCLSMPCTILHVSTGGGCSPDIAARPGHQGELHSLMKGRPMARKRNRVVRNGDVEDEEDDENANVSRVRNRVFFYSDTSIESVLKLVLALDEAAQWVLTEGHTEGSAAMVHLHIHSPGGDAYAGISAMEHVRRCTVPVHTHVDGYVASAATFMLLAGGRRTMGENGTILIHQLSTGFSGRYSELLEEVKNSEDLTRTIQDIYRRNTKMSKSTIIEVMANEVNLTSAECLQHGIVDEVW
jgi:ATP-dependent protease ClpP protease subunit